MACKTPPMSMSSTLFSDGTSTPIFVPVTGPIEVANVDMVGVAFEVQSLSAQLVLGAALRYSDDGVTWDALGSVSAVGSTTSSLGMAYRGFTTTDSTRRYFQVGFKCHSASGSEPDKGTVRLKLEFRC
ncbi:MAG TPA: hypothetical protein PKX25_17355 [Microthrixaceae bacterium]|nr:hypothetical protein [Microthrixaceae bacterium]